LELNDDDQTELKDKFGTSNKSKRKRRGTKIDNQSTEAKQSKIEEDEDKNSKKEQSDLLWKYKDSLRKEVPQDILKKLLESNSQKTVSGESNVKLFFINCLKKKREFL